MKKNKIFPEKELTYKILGAAMEVHNVLGEGFREKTYENTLIIEMKAQNICFSQQESYEVEYKNEKIDTFIPDIVVSNKVILECKTVEKIIDDHIGQLLNYLKVTGIKVGLILNFKNKKLEWKRVILKKKQVSVGFHISENLSLSVV